MASISHDCISVEGIQEKVEIMDFSMSIKPNQHGTAKIIIKYLSAITADEVKKNVQDKILKVKSSAKENDGILFAGYVDKFYIHLESGQSSENSFLEGEICLVSTTIKLDLELKRHSFQDKSLSYQDILMNIDCVYKECLEEAKSTKIEKPLIQYEETDWEFMLRLASHFGRQVVPVETAEKPTVFFGLKENGTVSEKSQGEVHTIKTAFRSFEYIWTKNIEDYLGSRFSQCKGKINDFETYDLKSIHNYQIGNKTVFQGKTFMVVQKEAKSVSQEIEFTYKLGSELYGGLKKIYNTKLHGRCLEGKVLSTNHEFVKIHLDMDDSQSESTAYEYEWRPDTGNIFYCMPEKGRKVSLYIGTAEEGDAYAINCIRREEPSCPDLKDVDKRYFTTSEKKRYYYKKDCMGFSNEEKDEGKTHVGLFDGKQIQLKSDKPIQIHADKKLNIESGSWSVEAKKEILLVQKKAGFDFNRQVDIKGSSVSVSIMAGAGASPSKESDKKAATPEKEKLKERALEKFSRNALSFVLKFDNTQRRANINQAVNQVSSKNPALSKSKMDHLRTKQGFMELKNQRTPAYNQSYDKKPISEETFGKPYEQAEIEILRQVRDAESVPDKNTVMQKVVHESGLLWLTGDSIDQAQFGGFMAKADDALPSTGSYQEARESLRLDYGSKADKAYPEKGKKMYVARFTADEKFYEDNFSVPYNQELGGTGELDKHTCAPCTGNGMLAGKDTLIPEWNKERRGNVSDGAIFIINDKGEEELYAVYNKSIFETIYT